MRPAPEPPSAAAAAMTPAPESSSVAVVIPTYDQAHYLPESVASAYAQTYAGALEVWVVDDASRDDTPAVLATLAERHPGLRTIAQPQNVGIAANVSTALAAPATEFVVRLDSDDVLEPAYVERLVARMQAHPRAGYGHTDVREIDRHGRPGRTRTLARVSGFVDGDTALRAALTGYRTVANVLMFRTVALAAVDYCRGRPDFVEDYDLAVRLADDGWGNVYLGEPLARYRIWDDAGGVRARRKGMQLDGYRRIFDEAIEPAWRRRGWPPDDVARRRARLAAHHAAACFAPQYAADETDELVERLLALGDGPAVRLRLALCRHGLAGALRRADALPPAARRTLKRLGVRGPARD